MEYEILNTGEFDKDSFLFKTLYLNIDINKSTVEDILKENQIDYICKKENGYIEFLHYTSYNNFKFIKKNGLINTNSNGDLGIGLYVIKEDDIIAFENLQDYIFDHYDYNEKFLEIRGFYEGTYYICISENNHEGYIIINQDIPLKNITDITIKKLSDFY